MRRGPSIGIAALALAGASTAAALAAAPAPPKLAPRNGSVSLTDCHPSDDVTQRYAAFSGQMRTLPGATQMSMRFTLLERLGAVGRFKPVGLPELRPWRRSKPAARTFIFTQRVTALHDDGSYRMRVQFRWYDAQGNVLRTSVARSRACYQPPPLPNLGIGAITAARGTDPDQRTYSITLTDTGKGEARDVDVALKVDGRVVGSSRVDLVPGEESTVVEMPGPACAFTVRAIADPDRLIRETDDSDNALTVPCPQAAA